MKQRQSNLIAILKHLGLPTCRQRHRVPTLDDIVRSPHRPQVQAIYEQLGGRLTRPPMNLREWDIELEQTAIEVDEEQHFNRYRLLTLKSPLYRYLSDFPLHSYQEYCLRHEGACLRKASKGDLWSTPSAELHFGPAALEGDLTGTSSPRWRQRAFYDFVKDISSLITASKVHTTRIPVWDKVTIDGQETTIGRYLRGSYDPKSHIPPAIKAYLTDKIAGNVEANTALASHDTELIADGALRLVAHAIKIQQTTGHRQLCVYHWLLALVERHAERVESLAGNIDATQLRQIAEEELRAGRPGKALSVEAIMRKAADIAEAPEASSQVTERAIARIVLAALDSPPTADTLVVPVKPALGRSTGQTEPQVPHASGEEARRDREKPPYRPHSTHSTPTLNEYGRDLTREAQEGKLPRMLGREAEIEMVIETLCRRFKPNPVLIGPAGVGKTAIVEGLAQRIVDGDVPDALRNSRLLAVQASGLVAGVGEYGQGEYMRRVTTLIEEASEDGVILFIDEMHSMVGVGGQKGTTDIASLLKPALARGDIACIAATTDSEYRQYIEPDGALERRFQPIHVQELSPEQTLVILSNLRDEIAGAKNVRVHDDVLRWIVGFAHEFVPDRYFPDKGVDLLDQCTAHAVAHRKSEVDLDTARIVAERLVGMPASLPERLAKLEQVLEERQILSAEDKTTLIGHLSVTMRGLDLSPARPNAVMLLVGEAAAHAGQLSESLAATLFGSPDRVVAIDFSRMTQSHDITMLIGAPPGYLGYSDTLPIHRVAQLQWCVLRCDNIDGTHPNTLAVLAQTLATGVITDAQGKKIYLKNAVVLMTASIGAPSIRRRGKGLNQQSQQEAAVTAVAREALGSNLVDQCDLVCHQRPGGTKSSLRAWIRDRLLPELATRYSTIGVNIEWDDTVADWLLSARGAQPSRREIEEQVSRVLNPQLVQNLPAIDERAGVRCVVSCTGDKVVVHLRPTEANHE